MISSKRLLYALVFGVLAGAALDETDITQGRRNTVPTDLPGLSAEVGRIQTLLANQSHVMADLSFQLNYI